MKNCKICKKPTPLDVCLKCQAEAIKQAQQAVDEVRRLLWGVK